MELIDSHCHLDALAESADFYLKRAADLGVSEVLTIGAGSGRKSNELAVSFAKTFPNVWASVGIHPHDADEFQDLSSLESYFLEPKVVAIGETGLDFFKNWSDFSNQETLFRNSVRTALNFNKPLIIHSRAAADMSLNILREEKAEKVGGVFHCYSEDAEFAKRLQDINFLVSFPGTVTFKNAENVQAAAKAIPIEQILVETDCPYMAPEPFRGKPSEPMHVYYTAKKIAELKGLTLEEAATYFTKNTKRLFAIS